MATAQPKGGSAVQRLQARTAPIAVQKGGEVEIPLDKIRFDSTQPRQAFHHPDGQVSKDDEQAIEALAETIKNDGLLQAIMVEPMGDGTYKVLVGERRTRAHILLGKPTIRATIRDDLAKKKNRRLIVQLVENVVREDLSDADMARSIRALMEGNADEAPMTQAQIAAELGKSEGWVSRYVRFGDEELQRLWVHSGIADTVEHLYRLSILPMPLQTEILRRVNLPEDHADFIAKPISRAILEDMSRQAKIAKAAEKAGRTGSPSPAVLPTSAAPSSTTTEAAPQGQAEGHADGTPAADPVTQALTEAAAAGQERQPGAAPTTTAVAGSAYQLPADLRANILAGANATPDSGQPSATLPPVTVRGNFGALIELLKHLEKADAKAAANGQATISLPAPIAQRLANTLSGNVVEPRAVAAAIHRHLSDN